MSQCQQPVKHCTAVGSCREAGKTNWRPATLVGHARRRRDVSGGIMVASGVTLDVQLLVTRRR